MPIHKCPNGKYKIGSGKCMYDTKESAEKAYKGYLASKHSDKANEEADNLINKIKEERKKIREMIDMLQDYSTYLWNLEYVKKYKAGNRGKDLYDSY